MIINYLRTLTSNHEGTLADKRTISPFLIMANLPYFSGFHLYSPYFHQPQHVLLHIMWIFPHHSHPQKFRISSLNLPCSITFFCFLCKIKSLKSEKNSISSSFFAAKTNSLVSSISISLHCSYNLRAASIFDIVFHLTLYFFHCSILHKRTQDSL